MVIEWNLKTQLPQAKYNCHCAIWDSVMVGKFIYLACEDGSIRVLKVKKNKIELVKQLVKSSASCLSVAVATLRDNKPLKISHNKKQTGSSSESEDEKEEENVGPVAAVFAGYADGTIKLQNILSGNCDLHIEKQTEKEKKKDGPCLIWRLMRFGSYVISGDSKGNLCFWDSKFGTLAAQFS
jgi:WD40 repeat protein